MDSATEYGEPWEMALRWQEAGASYLHVVDLDAAFAGEFSNHAAVEKLLKAVRIPVQLGGGVRTIGRYKAAAGDSGPRARHRGHGRPMSTRNWVAEAVVRYPGRIAVGIDARDGKVALKGSWSG